MRPDGIPRGSKFVCAEFDQTVIPRHPRTGEPIPPPLACTFSCTPESIGWTRARLTSLVSSTGWKLDGGLQEFFIYKEDAEGESNDA